VQLEKPADDLAGNEKFSASSEASDAKRLRTYILIQYEIKTKV
jgi:hypothetical protein